MDKSKFEQWDGEEDAGESKRIKLDGDVDGDVEVELCCCSVHRSQLLVYVCYDCNLLLCSSCLNGDGYGDGNGNGNGNGKHSGHVVEHIDVIRSGNEECCQVQRDISLVWSSIKSSTTAYCKLKQTELEISKEFSQMHEYLVVEEHKLKKPLINDKEIIELQINTSISRLQSLLKISRGRELKDSCIDKSNELPEQTSDTTEQYQIDNIIKLIQQSSNLSDFIQRDNNHLLYCNPSRLQEHCSRSYNDDYLLLDSIIKHYNVYRQQRIEDIDKQDVEHVQLRFVINDRYVKAILRDVKLAYSIRKFTDYFDNQMVISTAPTFILLSDKDDRLSRIDITMKPGVNIESWKKSFKIERLDCKLRDSWVGCATINVGGHIFSFGGPSMCNLYQRFSLKTMKIDLYKDMFGIEPCNYVSVCYDGQSTIYLLDSHQRDNTLVSQYDIQSQKFTIYSTIPNTEYIDMSFYYNDAIYCVIQSQRRVIVFDPATSLVTESKSLPKELATSHSRLCSDDVGNIYFLSSNQFIQFNVDTNQVKLLKPIVGKGEVAEAIEPLNHLLFHLQPNPNTNASQESFKFIYLLDGAHNYIYTIDTDQWESILEDESESTSLSNRQDCGACIFRQIS